MSDVAQARVEKLVTSFHSTYGLVALVGVNTFTLLAIERLSGIPSWIKTAAAIFLAL